MIGVERADVVIAGAGQAGAQTAMVLRQQKFAGSITMVGAEAALPYERPALSKEYLAGDKTLAKLLLRPASFWEDRQVQLCLGERISRIEAAEHRVHTAGGRVIEYGKLVWAAGGRPRQLPCDAGGLAGVHYVRDVADVDRLKGELAGVATVAVIGGGYIGLEVAAVLRKHDKRVTLLEAQDRVLARVAGEALSQFFAAEHRARGVTLHLGVAVTGIEAEDGRASGVRLAGGEVVPADVVVIGIGIAPIVEPLLAAGADGDRDRGATVDLHGKTSLPDVFAIGDCAAHPNVHAGGRLVRLESIQNANDQATVVAKAIAGTLGPAERYDAVPWFWSNQYDLRLQTVGLFHDHDDVVVRGDPESRSFSVVYLRAGRVIALDCVNATKDYMQGKALIASGREVDLERLASVEVMLKELC